MLQAASEAEEDWGGFAGEKSDWGFQSAPVSNNGCDDGDDWNFQSSNTKAPPGGQSDNEFGAFPDDDEFQGFDDSSPPADLSTEPQVS